MQSVHPRGERSLTWFDGSELVVNVAYREIDFISAGGTKLIDLYYYGQVARFSRATTVFSPTFPSTTLPDSSRSVRRRIRLILCEVYLTWLHSQAWLIESVTFRNLWPVKNFPRELPCISGFT